MVITVSFSKKLNTADAELPSANKVLRGRCDAGETNDYPKAEGDGLRVPSGELGGQNPRSRPHDDA